MEENDSLEFKTKASNIRRAVKLLREQEVISMGDATDFMLASYRARSLEDMQFIVSELARACEGLPYDVKRLRLKMLEN